MKIVYGVGLCTTRFPSGDPGPIPATPVFAPRPTGENPGYGPVFQYDMRHSVYPCLILNMHLILFQLC